MRIFNTSGLLKKVLSLTLALTVAGGAFAGAASFCGDKCSASVSAASAPTGIKLNVQSIVLGKGESYQLKAVVSPSDSADNKLTWSSSDKNKVSVSSAGLVKANNTGNAAVTVRTSNGKTASCNIIIKSEPSTVGISKNTISLGVGEIYTLSAILANGTASDKKTFRSSNGSVIKMLTTNRIGQIKALKEGTAVITVSTYNNKQASCKVTVKKAPSSVNVTKKTLEMRVGDSYTLGSSVPNGSAASKRTYRTSNSSIVKMLRTDWAGQFKALKPGVAWVTVRTYNGKESSCKIRVLEKPVFSNKIQNYNGKVYYTSEFIYKGFSGKLDMSALGKNYTALTKSLAAKKISIDSFIIYKGILYFKDQTSGTGNDNYPSKIYKCKMDGSSLKKIAESAETVFKIDNGKLIYNKYGWNNSFCYDISTGKTTSLSGKKQSIPEYEILKFDGRWGVTGGSNYNGYIFYKEKMKQNKNCKNISYYAKNGSNGKIFKLGEGYTSQYL